MKRFVSSLSIVVLISSTITSAQTWWGAISKELPSQTDFFSIEFDLVPRDVSVKRAHITLSSILPADWGDNACLIRAVAEDPIHFDARNGGSYEYQDLLPYADGESYHVKIEADVPSLIYSVFITPLPGEDEYVIGDGIDFRTEQVTAGIDQINYLNVTIPYSDGADINDPGADLLNIDLKDEAGTTVWQDDGLIWSEPADGVASKQETPASFNLKQNYPNPFNPMTTISFTLPENDQVTLKVYNMRSELITTLANQEVMAAGEHSVTFDASHLSSGVYFYQLSTAKSIEIKKMTLLR